MITTTTAGLLRHYADRIEQNEIGLKFNMSTWISPSEQLEDLMETKAELNYADLFKVRSADDERLHAAVPLTELEDAHKCGTAACIAGHISVMSLQAVPIGEDDISYMDHARKILGINRAEAAVLFVPWGAGMSLTRGQTFERAEAEDRAFLGDFGSWNWNARYQKDITREIAVAAMRKVAETKTFVGCWPEEFDVDYSAVAYCDAHPEILRDDDGV